MSAHTQPCGCTTKSIEWSTTHNCKSEDVPDDAPYPRHYIYRYAPVLCATHEAAPELLEAMRGIMGSANAALDEPSHDHATFLKDILEEAKEAIAKAEAQG